jgi:hypothetical protein
VPLLVDVVDEPSDVVLDLGFQHRCQHAPGALPTDLIQARPKFPASIPDAPNPGVPAASAD